MSSEIRRRIEPLTGLFSLRPRKWKGAIALCGDFFLRSRHVNSAMTEKAIFQKLENWESAKPLCIILFLVKIGLFLLNVDDDIFDVSMH
ncbi:hypothetical protein PW252_09405 [Streptococcus sp. 29887]|uniref:Uncharacterized protein n=1 Tax=Streptococcus iners TaxID=3028084 RepID=A0AA96VLR2_9STRE|nr:hypothetical protein [Streptococcus sp. 29887]MCK4025362.1 hypothetical protein [Streptococcus suis]WNY50776.1 hypothetical protein PW252_09405 [Streptococcus sp. 29887]